MIIKKLVDIEGEIVVIDSYNKKPLTTFVKVYFKHDFLNEDEELKFLGFKTSVEIAEEKRLKEEKIRIEEEKRQLFKEQYTEKKMEEKGEVKKEVENKKVEEKKEIGLSCFTEEKDIDEEPVIEDNSDGLVDDEDTGENINLDEEEKEAIERLKSLGFSNPDMTFKKYYGSPLAMTTQFYFCPMPLRLDTYSGCSHGCVYCFANNSDMKYINDEQYLKTNREDLSVRPTKFKTVKKYFDVAFEGKENTFQNQEALAIECIKRRVPIHWGGMSDPFQPIEKLLGLSYRVLELCKKYKYPIVVSTKGELILDDRYFDLITSMKDTFALQISLIHFEDKIIKLLDPNAPSATTRFAMMKKYSDAGVWVACRIQPIILNLLKEYDIPKFIKLLHDNGVKHVMVEGLKFFSGNKEANKRIGAVFKAVTGQTYDLEAYYKSIGAKNSGNDLELPTWRKNRYAKIFQRELKKYGMTYGAADNDLRFMGDSACCCGVEPLKNFGENLIRHNTGFAVFNAMRSGKKEITYDDIKGEWFPDGTFRQVISVEKLKKKYGKDATYKDANTSIREMFMAQWNKGSKNSPCQQCIIKFGGCGADGCGKYKFKEDLEAQEELKDRGEQQTLF